MGANSKKMRFDLRVQAEMPERSRQQIQSWIMQGKIQVDGRVVTKPGVPIAADAQLSYDIEEPRYVSRAGFKLEAALDQFELDVSGKVALDAGISTGGFTDCLLQRGIAKIYGIDVGYGLVHERVRNDERLVLMERTNLRHVESLPEPLDLVCLDLSFISLCKVAEVVTSLLKPEGTIVTLIKPQFEAQRNEIGKGGIVRNPAVHDAAIERVTDCFATLGFVRKGLIESPITGGSGNKEFLALFVRKSDELQGR